MGLFDDMADAVVGTLPPALGPWSIRRSGRNLKLWSGEETHEHYEAQVIGRADLEVGFHAEHADARRNQAVIDHLLTVEKRWRKELGKDAEAGVFLGGRPKNWRRISERWPGPDLESFETALEAADRLTTYVRALEPLRRTR